MFLTIQPFANESADPVDSSPKREIHIPKRWLKILEITSLNLIIMSNTKTLRMTDDNISTILSLSTLKWRNFFLSIVQKTTGPENAITARMEHDFTKCRCCQMVDAMRKGWVRVLPADYDCHLHGEAGRRRWLEEGSIFRVREMTREFVHPMSDEDWEVANILANVKWRMNEWE